MTELPDIRSDGQATSERGRFRDARGDRDHRDHDRFARGARRDDGPQIRRNLRRRRRASFRAFLLRPSSRGHVADRGNRSRDGKRNPADRTNADAAVVHGAERVPLRFDKAHLRRAGGGACGSGDFVIAALRLLRRHARPDRWAADLWVDRRGLLSRVRAGAGDRSALAKLDVRRAVFRSRASVKIQRHPAFARRCRISAGDAGQTSCPEELRPLMRRRLSRSPFFRRF